MPLLFVWMRQAKPRLEIPSIRSLPHPQPDTVRRRRAKNIEGRMIRERITEAQRLSREWMETHRRPD